jgi:hypothetical protein
MPAPTSGGAFGRGLLPMIALLAALLSANDAFAQATGGVSVPPKGPAGLEALAKRMAESPETRLDVYVTPQFTYEKFHDYEEVGQFRDPVLGEATIVSPEFTISTTDISAAADYLFVSGLFLGGAFTYSYADYDFDHGPLSQAFEAADQREEQGALGEPLDRSFDQYGFTLTTGYLKDPWAVLLTGRYARRDNIETLRREAVQGARRNLVLDAKGNTKSNIYAVGPSVNYRIGFENGAALTGLTSILYQREEIDGYTERVESVFAQPAGSKQITQISEDELPGNKVRKFNGQTINSIPFKVGALASVPVDKVFSASIDKGKAGKGFALTTMNVGVTYTHDFDNQRRTVKSEFVDSPDFSVEYEEKNRNQDFVSFLGALDFDLLNLVGTISYQGDVGFDEREYAHIFTLQLRVPLSF